MSKQHSRFFGPQAVDLEDDVPPKRIYYTTPIFNRIEQLPPRSRPVTLAKPNALHTRRLDLEHSVYPALELAKKSDVAVCTTTIRVQQLRDLVNPLEQDSSSLAILKSTLRVSGAFTDDEEVSNSSANQMTEVRHYHGEFCTACATVVRDADASSRDWRQEQRLKGRRDQTPSKYDLCRHPPKMRTWRSGRLRAYKIT
ncbi:hypothetical protein LTS10_010111 [Elasticomyces elasticus]|nr:hypothetical protein LTS10_010111 [Elasticomyces elasticus]